MFVYVASSWSNPMQEAVCETLAAAGIDHYDFKADGGFRWSEVFGGVKKDYSAARGDTIHVDTYLEGLESHRAHEGFRRDYDAMQMATHFLLVLPCNRSAHLELGWAWGQQDAARMQGHRNIYPLTGILLDPDDNGEVVPELMYRGIDNLFVDMMQVLAWLEVVD